MKMKPSNFLGHPWDSVLKNNESETIARNIMAILKRTGDEWRLLTWEEYSEERKKDGSFTERERAYFDRVVGFCGSAESAEAFAPGWGKTTV
jgi:hypothetical protein